MKRQLLAGALGAVILSVGATGFAAAAEPPERVDGFVCPVLGGEGGVNAVANGNGPFITIADGDISILGPDVSVPMHATNDDGAGSPGGAHASPGDPDYTAIWAK